MMTEFHFWPNYPFNTFIAVYLCGAPHSLRTQKVGLQLLKCSAFRSEPLKDNRLRWKNFNKARRAILPPETQRKAFIRQFREKKNAY